MMCSITLVLLLVVIRVESFVSRTFLKRFVSLHNEPVSYNDFDFVVGQQDDDNMMSTLRERVARVKEQEKKKHFQLDRNWKQGNWKVQGFSLDHFDPKKDVAGIHVSRVQMCHEEDSVVVGRTDGSVFVIELGTEHYTRFQAKLTAKMGANDTVSVQTELGRPQKDNTVTRPQEAQDMLMLMEEEEEVQPSGVPFEVMHQFVAHENQTISALLVTESKRGRALVTASDQGNLAVWRLPDTRFPTWNLNAHSSRVVTLETVSMRGRNLLFSASVDGTMALWDVSTGDLVYKCQGTEITCATTNHEDYIFVGLAGTGQVLAYSVTDLVECGSRSGNACPVPVGRFQAHDGSVTAVECAGGTKSSTVLLTGGSDGLVKQWELFSRVSAADNQTRLEHWPRLANQRMPSRAHLFRGHDKPITALKAVDGGARFLSASVDGSIRAWDPSKGTELFFLDGFTDKVSSLCSKGGMLVTDGMEHYVCVHDFNVDENEMTNGYEMEW